jgi:hypothetical protein
MKRFTDVRTMFQVGATGIEKEEETALILHTIMTQMIFLT